MQNYQVYKQHITFNLELTNKQLSFKKKLLPFQACLNALFFLYLCRIFYEKDL